VQEAAYVALGLIFGIDSQISLSLSLLRRGRDILIGIPVLLGWQVVEMNRLRKERATLVGSHEDAVSSVLKKARTTAMTGSVSKDGSSNRENEKEDDAAFAAAPRTL